MIDVLFAFFFGTSFGFWLGALYWREVVKKSHDQIERMLDTWEPKRVVIRVEKEWRG